MFDIKFHSPISDSSLEVYKPKTWFSSSGSSASFLYVKPYNPFATISIGPADACTTGKQPVYDCNSKMFVWHRMKKNLCFG